MMPCWGQVGASFARYREWNAPVYAQVMELGRQFSLNFSTLCILSGVVA